MGWEKEKHVVIPQKLQMQFPGFIKRVGSRLLVFLPSSMSSRDYICIVNTVPPQKNGSTHKGVFLATCGIPT